MKNKSILEQVEEQEKRRKESEKSNLLIKRMFIILSAVVIVVSVIVGVFAYQYFQPTEAELAYKAEQREMRLLNNARIDRCESLIKKELNYPSTYKMEYRDVKELDTSVYIHIAFTAKNAFGADLPQSGQCADTGGKMILIDIRNR